MRAVLAARTNRTSAPRATGTTRPTVTGRRRTRPRTRATHPFHETPASTIAQAPKEASANHEATSTAASTASNQDRRSTKPATVRMRRTVELLPVTSARPRSSTGLPAGVAWKSPRMKPGCVISVVTASKWSKAVGVGSTPFVESPWRRYSHAAATAAAIAPADVPPMFSSR